MVFPAASSSNTDNKLPSNTLLIIKLGLIGFPLSHSASPGIFQDIFRHEGITGAEYKLIPLENEAALKAFIRKPGRLDGFNITRPYKKSIIPFLDRLSPEAQAIGAVNCVKVTRREDISHLEGFNTDFTAFHETIRHQLLFRRTGVLVLGTGGVAKAVCYALQQLEVSYLTVSRAKSPGNLTYDEILEETIGGYGIIVNCTPLGMHQTVNEAPPIPYHLLGPRNLCYDLVYTPPKTRFLLEAEKQGAAIINGLLMLHLQAMKSWEIWKGAVQ